MISAAEARQHPPRDPVDPVDAAAEPDRVRAVPDPGERVRPGLEVAGEDPVEHLLPHGRCQRPEVVDVLGVAGEGGWAVLER